MWINDVVTRTTILSTWGNGVRNQLHQIFDSLAEANSHLAALPDGALATIAGRIHLKVAGAWRVREGALIWGGNYQGSNTGNLPKRAADVAIPAGYASARVAWDGTVANAGTIGLLGHVFLRSGTGTLLAQRDVTVQPGTYVPVAMSTNYAPNAAGETPYVEYVGQFEAGAVFGVINQNLSAIVFGY